MWVEIAAMMRSGNSLRQTVHTSCLCSPSVEIGSGVRAGVVTAGLAESNGSLPPGL